MGNFFYVVTLIFLAFVIVVDGIYFVGGVFAMRRLAAYGRLLRRSTAAEAFASPLTPGVSILMAAHNENPGILDTVWSLLNLRYPKFEVIIVENGSTDGTAQALQQAFDMRPVWRALRNTVAAGSPEQSYRSTRYPNLWLLCKQAPGKADALNTGLNAASYPYVMAVDADGLMEPAALLGAMQPILDSPEIVVGSCGVVRPVNACRVERGRVAEVELPRDVTSGIQVVEYLRTFLVMRMFWTDVNVLVIASGAFSIFKRSVVEQVGGWFTRTAADDVEMAIHVHRQMRDLGQPYRLELTPEPVCWTEAPHRLRDLLSQRRRWHRGICESVWRHRGVIGRPRYGRLGLLAMPIVLIEIVGPLIEVLSWLLVLTGALLGAVSIGFFLVFLLVATLANLSLSLLGLSMAQVQYRRSATGPETTRLVGYALLEILGLRQLLGLWCSLGILDFMRSSQRYEQPRRSAASVR